MSWLNPSWSVQFIGSGRSGLASAGTGAHTAVVQDARRGTYVLNRRATQAEMMLARSINVFAVDTGEHVAESSALTLTLPSADPPFAFTAQVKIGWRVTDPVAAVNCELRHPWAPCEPYVDRMLRDAARRFPITRSAALNAYLDGLRIEREFAEGVTVLRCTAQIWLDATTKEHLDALAGSSRAQERRRAEHEELMHDRRLQLDEIDLEQELILKKADFERSLERRQNTHELAIEGDRMRFYADALHESPLNVAALQLASQNPNVKEVIALFVQERKLGFEQAHGVITALLDSGLINRSDARDLTTHVAKVIAEQLTRSQQQVPGIASASPLQLAAEPPATLTAEDEEQRRRRKERRRLDGANDAKEDTGER